MIRWDDLHWSQKAAFWCVIGIVGWFAPEIALLFHFGGIEVVFAFLAFYFTPIIGQLRGYLEKFKSAVVRVYVAYQNSASATPRVFFVQATFCSLAFVLTGSFACASVFLMPGLALNGLLI